METSIDRTKWYDRILASFIYFTRLPFWRMHEPPKECFAAVMEHWPLTGWLTGGLMAATLYVGSMYLPYMVAVLLAIVVRLLVTGARQEDGLADFLDGFGGGGNDRRRILAIMRDPRTGTYGVVGLVVYILLLAGVLYSMVPKLAAIAILAADPFSKMVTSQLVMMMPYAYREEERPPGTSTAFRKMDMKAGISLAIQGLLPIAAFIWLTDVAWEILFFIPCIIMYFLYLMIWRRLRGYTFGCCGAVSLIIELMIYVIVCATVTTIYDKI